VLCRRVGLSRQSSFFRRVDLSRQSSFFAASVRRADSRPNITFYFSVASRSGATRISESELSMSVFSKTVFRESAADMERLPADNGREVAFVGRSNAGKSSTINALTGIGRLAFVSKQPGRTQLINLFEVIPGRRIVDLPGYGYAKVAKDIKRDWGILLERYLQERRELVGLVVIMDIRHPLTPLDLRLIEWIAPRGLPLHIVLSKSDKLNRQDQVRTQREVVEAMAPFAGLPVTVQTLSSPKRLGLDTLATTVAGWLGIQETAPVSSSSARGAKALAAK
jgi:GTP-binding protein